MPDKLLTVIVPSYNMEEYLPKCLGSLIVPDEAMLQRLDVIVVNDGSKDRTSEIAHDFEKRYPGVFSVIDKKNGNYGSCINAALPEASGEYIRVLDADDFVDTVAFQSLLAILQQETTAKTPSDLVVSDYAFVNPEGTVIKCVGYHFPPGPGHTLQDAQSDSPRFTIHSIVYRTEILIAMGYHQTEGISYTDTEWIIEPMTQIRLVRYHPVVVTKYLFGRNGQTMEDAVFAMRFQQVIQITTGLATRYSNTVSRCVPEAQSYYKGKVLRMIAMCYNTCFLGWKGRHVHGDLNSLDIAVRQTPDLYAGVIGIRAPYPKFPVRFVKAHFHDPGIGTPVLLGLRFFLFVRHLWHHMRRQ